MYRSRILSIFLLAATSLCAAPAAKMSATLQPGKAALKSAGPLAFGPEGILFVGDFMGAAIFALDTADTKAAKPASLELAGIDQKIAALLGTTADQILINDMAVNSVSRRAYISVSRGRGPDGTPVILRTTAAGNLEILSLDNIRHSSVTLPNSPAMDAKDRRGSSLRLEAITDIGFVDGNVIVAGLSNEEFSSNLRSIPFPFKEASAGASVEIYHGQHGRFETNSPVRTFTTYDIQKQAHLLAAYTCTPLVKVPISDLQPGKKIKGVTIAELGNRNRPLDMIVYKKGGADFILMNNSSRGVMKMPAAKLESYEAITAQVELKGVPYETIASLKGVEQLDRFDDSNALMMIRAEGGSVDLKTVALP
ncbi:MAG: hypothetical protein JJE04_17725 [Acidobacteriia bacterium]|nr:hypothetical protein [Terriglobia bacterium]